LFVTVPQGCPLHGFGSGTQPLHVPPLHVCGLAQVPQFTETPQLSCNGPQRLVQKFGSELHTQTFPASTAHVCVPLHPPQPTVIPQLSGPDPQWVEHQFRSGVQLSPGASCTSAASLASAASPASTPDSGPVSGGASPVTLPSAVLVSCVVWSTGDTTSCAAASS
jgi:hypothetical protein